MTLYWQVMIIVIVCVVLLYTGLYFFYEQRNKHVYNRFYTDEPTQELPFHRR